MRETTLLLPITEFGSEMLNPKLIAAIGNNFPNKWNIASELYQPINPLKEIRMTLFPNPAIATEPVRLSFEKPTFGNIHIKIFDQKKHCVLTHLILNADGVDTHFLDIKNLNPGIYSVELENSGRTGNQKLIVQ